MQVKCMSDMLGEHWDTKYMYTSTVLKYNFEVLIFNFFLLCYNSRANIAL